MVLLAHSLLAGRLTAEELGATQEEEEEAQGTLHMFTRSHPEKGWGLLVKSHVLCNLECT